LYNLLLENLEIALFVRAGSIIPIKLHRNAQALLRTLRMPLRLDVYLSGDGSHAEGLLYLDDGESFRYATKNEKALIKYTY
jgi:alpha-glucosidase (family GH31 glycosyl hydrolase)